MRNNTLPPRPPARSRLRFVHLILISLLFPYSVLPSFRARLSIFRAGGDEDEKASEDNECIPLRPTLARPQEVKGKVHAAHEGRARRSEASGPNTRHSPRTPEEWGNRGVIGRVELKKDQDEETVRPALRRPCPCPPPPLPSSTHGIKGLSEIGSNASEGRPTTLPST